MCNVWHTCPSMYVSYAPDVLSQLSLTLVISLPMPQDKVAQLLLAQDALHTLDLSKYH